MKKYLAGLIVISLCMLVPMYARASQGSLETKVPSTHTVAIEAEHASALYIEGDKGLSSAYPVPRFSSPQFKITVEDGYVIKRVLLNGEDVTKKIKKDILKISEVCENQVIRIETEAISQETSEDSQTPQATQTSEEVKETVQKQDTGEQMPGTEPSKTENESDGSSAENESDGSGTEKEQEEIEQTTSGDETPQNLPENERHFIGWAVLLPAASISAGFIFLIKKRKIHKK